MNKPLLGVAVGTLLGIVDGASAWAYPEARPMILLIVVSSTLKGALTGLAAGLIARRVRSVGIGIAAGLVVGLVLSLIASAASPPGPDGSQPFFEIVLPGMLLGAIVGFATQRYPKTVALVLALIAATPLAIAAQAPKADDPLQPLAFLLGTWKGTSSGQPGDGTVEREYSRALNGRFIQVRNRSVYPPQKNNPKGETHEDVGFISFDRGRSRFVLRQFHIEGFVNHYVAEAPAAGSTKWVFTSEAIENIPAGWRARETYTMPDANTLEEMFELAEPGKEFQLYSRTALKRVP